MPDTDALGSRLHPAPTAPGPRLRALRRASGFRQEDLAGRAGISRNHLALLESGWGIGAANPRWGTLEALASALEVSVIDLVAAPAQAFAVWRWVDVQTAEAESELEVKLFVILVDESSRSLGDSAAAFVGRDGDSYALGFGLKAADAADARSLVDLALPRTLFLAGCLRSRRGFLWMTNVLRAWRASSPRSDLSELVLET